jgi:hypothetical protein
MQLMFLWVKMGFWPNYTERIKIDPPPRRPIIASTSGYRGVSTVPSRLQSPGSSIVRRLGYS